MGSVASFRRDLEHFLALAEELSYRRAAERLYIGQPALSTRIKGLERELGVELFARLPRGIQLTDAGEAFMVQARELLGHVDRCLVTCRRAARPRDTSLAAGYAEAEIAAILPDAIATVRQHEPSVDLTLLELPVALQLAQLSSGRLDVGFLRLPASHPDLCFETLWVEPIVACMQADHPLSRREMLTLDDLAGEPLLALSKDHPQHEQLDSALEPAGVTDAVIKETNRCSMMLHLAAAGLGVGVMAASTASAAGGRVALVPIAGLASALLMAWRADRTTPLVEAFLDAAREAAAPWAKLLAATGRDTAVNAAL